ncbi:hypothetical protein QBC32DRAFT_317248 [Pseudoneurospora amorphoporcata]|uniref:Uncharacterized protein n=1 Tax=Pseudoneurospora amorphoporcata TaxID=241081 RepID=A0AAN6SCW9_9PEZI|nr:hypothetical protein QBC32DRAFT_317248 [Pseudoneurospora amorphoporcata]
MATPRKDYNQALAETIIANVFIALRRCTTQAGHKGQPRFPRQNSDSPHVVHGYHIDDWFRTFHTLSVFFKRRNGKVTLRSNREPRHESGAVAGLFVFPPSKDTSLAATDEHTNLAHNQLGVMAIELRDFVTKYRDAQPDDTELTDEEFQRFGHIDHWARRIFARNCFATSTTLYNSFDAQERGVVTNDADVSIMTDGAVLELPLLWGGAGARDHHDITLVAVRSRDGIIGVLDLSNRVLGGSCMGEGIRHRGGHRSSGGNTANIVCGFDEGTGGGDTATTRIHLGSLTKPAALTGATRPRQDTEAEHQRNLQGSAEGKLSPAAQTELQKRSTRVALLTRRLSLADALAAAPDQEASCACQSRYPQT